MNGRFISASTARLDFILALAQYGGRSSRRSLIREFGHAGISRHEKALTKLGLIRKDDGGRSLTLTPSGKRAVRGILHQLGEPGPAGTPLALRRALRVAVTIFSGAPSTSPSQ